MTLFQCWYPYKKGEIWTQRQTDTGKMTWREGGRTRLLQAEERGPEKKSTLLTFCSRTSSLDIEREISGVLAAQPVVLCYGSPSRWTRVSTFSALCQFSKSGFISGTMGSNFPLQVCLQLEPRWGSLSSHTSRLSSKTVGKDLSWNSH